MSTIWADTVDQARDAARKFVYAGLSDNGELYGLHDCVYNYESVKVLHTLSAVAVCTIGMEIFFYFCSGNCCSTGLYREQTTEQFVKDLHQANVSCIVHLRTFNKQLHANLSQCLDVNGLQSVDIEALKVVNQCYDRALEVCNMLLF